MFLNLNLARGLTLEQQLLSGSSERRKNPVKI